MRDKKNTPEQVGINMNSTNLIEELTRYTITVEELSLVSDTKVKDENMYLQAILVPFWTTPLFTP